jgi:hypothetical protein
LCVEAEVDEQAVVVGLASEFEGGAVGAGQEVKQREAEGGGGRADGSSGGVGGRVNGVGDGIRGWSGE